MFDGTDLVIAASFLKTFLSDGDDFRKFSLPGIIEIFLFFSVYATLQYWMWESLVLGTGERSVLKYSTVSSCGHVYPENTTAQTESKT